MGLSPEQTVNPRRQADATRNYYFYVNSHANDIEEFELLRHQVEQCSPEVQVCVFWAIHV